MTATFEGQPHLLHVELIILSCSVLSLMIHVCLWLICHARIHSPNMEPLAPMQAAVRVQKFVRLLYFPSLSALALSPCTTEKNKFYKSLRGDQIQAFLFYDLRSEDYSDRLWSCRSKHAPVTCKVQSSHCQSNESPHCRPARPAFLELPQQCAHWRILHFVLKHTCVRVVRLLKFTCNFSWDP